MSQGIFLAKALYDNVAETADELGFRRGDVLTVLEQDAKGLDGWWLCTLRGKQGIAPGNRLKIISGLGDVAALDGSNKGVTDLYSQVTRGQQDYDVPPPSRSSYSRRPSYDALRNFVGPRKASFGDDLYDTPTSSRRVSAENINGTYDTPPSSKRASSERTPPHSNRSSVSRDSGFNLQSSNSPSQLSLNLQNSGGILSLPTVVRRRSESISSEKYSESTPGSNRSSLDRILSEEGPPIYESLSPATSTEQLSTEDPTYDTPPSRSLAQAQVNPASNGRLRSAVSKDSLLSNTSSLGSARTSQTPSLPNSARSSMDLPSEIYDVPSRGGKESDRSRKQLSMDSGLGFYDSPVRSRPSSSTSNNVTLETMKLSHSSFDCKVSPSPKDIKRSKSLENAVDDLYDTPRSNAPKVGQKKLLGVPLSGSSTILRESSGVYDIPPQVTRDSVISTRSDSSDESLRLSSCSLDSEQQLAEVLQWEELLLDFDSAMELLVKRQQDMFKATSRLTSFVNNTWRSQSSLEKTLYDIKQSCTLVRNSLLDFVDFSHGTMANAFKLCDHQIASRLQKYVSPLHSTLDLVNKSFINLEEMKWQVSLLSEPLDKTRPDHLGHIALVAKELMPEVKKVASYIQSNGSILFRKTAVGEGKNSSVYSKPPIVPKSDESNGVKVSNYGKAKNMQCRPLPAVPSPDKSLQELLSSTDTRKLSLYDIKAALHKDDYAECDELPPEKDSQLSSKQLTNKADTDQCIDEYDYVQLDSRNSQSRSHNKDKTPVSDINNVFDQNKLNTISSTEANDSTVINTPTKNSINFDSTTELFPVKDTATEIITDNVESRSEINSLDVSKEDTIAPVSDDTSEADQSEPEFTPVNIISSSSNSADFSFPVPEPEPGTSDLEVLDPSDRQVLVFYTEQMNAHSTLLANALDAFIGVVASKEPPNVFISHSKFVIVSAHKLVHIGDSIHRNLISNTVSLRVMHVTNQLCDCLKASVMATKTAALQYPSPLPVQEMVDRVVAVSHAAHELKLVITQAARQ